MEAAKKHQLPNVEFVLCGETDSWLPPESHDFVPIANAYPNFPSRKPL